MDLSAPSIMPPQVRVPSTPSTLFSIYIVQIVYLSFELECEKNKNKQKEAGIGPFFKKVQILCKCDQILEEKVAQILKPWPKM